MSVIEILALFVNAFWLVLPAGFANMAPTIFGGGLPMDFGRSFSDGRRILGDGKTWRGFASGVIVGAFIALVLTWISRSANTQYLPDFGEPVYAIYLGGILGTGALFGDAVKSFFKRRMGIARGGKWPVADQLDFIAGSWLFAFVFANDWFMAHLIGPGGSLAWIMLITAVMIPALHRLMNILGYALGLKKVPW
ncbi:MAG: CDP-2,3-bis-(O-geranylgeranyl)-sn-glycerol synthase [Candidatus Thermoplasmatota archaeon]|nr:CDP-2,3-bis-(O-geranylgeranyl)-sn-glycerol synthase [Candidatus Thermoplasmatota archaeon]